MLKQILLFTWYLVWANSSLAMVKYDEGRLVIGGIQLLQDHENLNHYYYLPQYPRLAQRIDGTFEVLCIKYVGSGGPETNGGLFHALIEFALTSEEVKTLQTELRKITPTGKIIGPIPMLQSIREDGEGSLASFEVVSSIIRNTGGNSSLTQSFITSGYAPLLPGSRTAIAAKLNQEGATLLWESFQGSISDVSISISGYFEALVRGYGAIIEAEVSTIYNHFSQIVNDQQGFSRDQLRNITDKLIQNQIITIEVVDRSYGLGIKAGDMQTVVDLATNKLIELMFDAKTGWSSVPEIEASVEKGQIPGRQKKGAFLRFFSNTGNQSYVTDHQFVLKQRKDIRAHKFYLNLSKSTTIKVPFYSSGNIRGFYDIYGINDNYFRIINLDDPDFRKREVIFQVDREFAQSFGDILNFVTVSFKKIYKGSQTDIVNEIVIKGKDLENGTDLKTITYPALGLNGDDLIEYNYRVSWSFKGDSKTMYSPTNPNDWLTGREAAISLKPPFEKYSIEIDSDREIFKDAQIRSAVISFFTVLNGNPKIQRTITLREGDAQNTQKVTLYSDFKEPVAYRVTWYPAKKNKIEGKLTELNDNYLYIIPPQ